MTAAPATEIPAQYLLSNQAPEPRTLVDILYDTDADVWLDAYMRRHQLRNEVFERRNPDGRWYKVFDIHAEDGTFIGVRVDISEIKDREKISTVALAKKTGMARPMLSTLLNHPDPNPSLATFDRIVAALNAEPLMLAQSTFRLTRLLLGVMPTGTPWKNSGSAKLVTTLDV